MFLALSDPVISDLLINTVLWFVRRGPVGVSEKQKIFNNSFLPMSRSVDGFSMPVIEYAGELLSASLLQSEVNALCSPHSPRQLNSKKI